MKAVAPGDVDVRRLVDRADARLAPDKPTEPVSLQRPTGAPGCWKCSRSGPLECGRVDCGNRAHLTAAAPAGARADGFGCFAVQPHFFGD